MQNAGTLTLTAPPPAAGLLRVAVLWALLGGILRVAPAAEGAAGWPELAGLDQRLHELVALVDAAERRQATADAQLGSWCCAQVSQHIADASAPSPGITHCPYPDLLRERLGFDSRGPIPAWQAQWRLLLETSCASATDLERLRIALHRLQHLRARLARQLQGGLAAP